VRTKQTKQGKTYTSKLWYGLRKYKGKRYSFPLGNEQKKALETWAEILLKIKMGKIPFSLILQEYHPRYKASLGVEAVRLPKLNHPADLSIGEHIDFVRSQLKALDMKPKTFRDCANSLLRVVAVGVAQAEGDEKPLRVRSTDEKEKLLELPLSSLTRALVGSFKIAFTSGIDEDEEEELLSRKRSVNSYLRQSKALFSQKSLGLYEDMGESPPDMTKFMGVRFFSGVEDPGYRLPKPDLIQRTFKALEAPKGLTFDAYVAILVGLFAGTRKKEASGLVPDCPNFSYEFPVVEIWKRTKGKKPRCVPMENSVLTWIEAYRKTVERDFLISGNMTYRIDGVFDEANAWLRSLGWDVRKPYHELRRLFGSMIATTEDMNAAQRQLGHKSIRTTEGYYTDNRMATEISALWSDFKPASLERWAQGHFSEGDSKGDGKA
jgi:integrase